MNLKIRKEMDGDTDTITDVIIAAFKDLEISNHTEQPKSTAYFLGYSSKGYSGDFF